MNRPTIRRLVTASVAAAALAIVAIGGAVNAADGGGIRNCVDITGRQLGQAGCYEHVWAGGAEYRMTFSNVTFSGATPKDLDPFYVLAPQTDEPQGAPPNTFAHDHVTRDLPAHNGGTYSTKLQGVFVLCSGQGIATGACAFEWTAPDGVNPLPFAKSVHGRPLTSSDAIESAAHDGDLVLIDLGPSAVIVASFNQNR
jgi:hypothetical protein